MGASNVKKACCHSSLLNWGSSAHEQATSQPLPWQATSPPAQCTMVVFMNLPVPCKYGCPLQPIFIALWVRDFGKERLRKHDETFSEWQIFGIASNAKMSRHFSLLDQVSPTAHEQALSQPLPLSQCTMVVFMNLPVTCKHGCSWRPIFLALWVWKVV